MKIVADSAQNVPELDEGNNTYTKKIVIVSNKHTVTFYGGGKTLGSASVEVGKNTSQAGASAYHPTRSGYTLTGWYDADGNMMFNAEGFAVNGKYWNGNYTRDSSGKTLTSATWKYSGNVTVYAQWTNKYTVTFYGGGKTLGSSTVEFGKSTNQAAASAHHPTRSGYTLTGWCDANGNILFNAQGFAVNGKYWSGSYTRDSSGKTLTSATWKYSGNVTVYARWTNKYTMTFCNGSDRLGSSTVEVGKSTNQAAASAHHPTRSGYTLAGWYDANGNILFNAQGFAVNGKYWSGSYTRDSSGKTLTSATWKYSGNVTVYARWTNKYTVTFYGGGTTLGSSTVEVGKSTNQAAASAHHPTRSGYTLTGWCDASGNIVFNAQGFAVNGKYWNGSYTRDSSGKTLTSATWKYSGNITVYAQWTNKYTLTFYGGGKTLGSSTVEVGKSTNQAAASAHHPTRSGYTLTGWCDANGNMMFNAQGFAVNGKYWNGSYTRDSSGKTLTSATWKYSGNVTAYANWAPATTGLQTALDNTSLAFTTGGTSSWYSQTAYSHDGTDAARSGALGDNQTSWLQTMVSGQGTISFWWYASSEAYFDCLEFLIDGTVKGSMSGTNNVWTLQSFQITSSGTHTLQWRYSKDGSDGKGLDAGFVDQVAWTSSGKSAVALSGSYAAASTAGSAAEVESGVADSKSGKELFAAGELAGTFADGGGTFLLKFDESMNTAYLMSWTPDGYVACGCEAEVVSDTLCLLTERGEVYLIVWDNGELVAKRIE